VIISSFTLIGVDCAVDEKKVGLARARWDGKRTHLWQVAVGGRGESIAETIAGWITTDRPTLIALDAPLGWPAVLGETLRPHIAGELLDGTPNELFRRQTDHFIKAVIGRQPLDVGADRIARTAYAALDLLEQLRQRSGEPIPLAWSPHDPARVTAIEVYPAATLTVNGLPAAGYKRKEQVDVRRAQLAGLRTLMDLPEAMDLMLAKADVLDAAICVLAGADFLAGKSLPPENLPLAKKEGWIWVKDPGNRT
jgi:predicted RNase H-like nuclease